MDPDDRDRHVAEPTYHPDVSVDAELAPGFSQQVENTNNSNYLDSLDPSLLGSPDFDFSCLMDLDEAAEATQEPEHLGLWHLALLFMSLTLTQATTLVQKQIP